jgi:uncharacterized protein (UPF0332 family)
VTGPVRRELDWARREVGAARALIDAGFPEKAVSSAYYAVYHTAVAALLALGEARSKHSGVLSAFGRLVIKEGGFDREVGAVRVRLFERRKDVDYDLVEQSAEEAAADTDDAERFVDEVERWIEDRSAAE